MASKNASISHDTQQVPINNLIELLPPTYNNLTPLRSFLDQVDSSLTLADPTQKQTLLLFVINRIGVKAKEHINMLPNMPETWPELAKILIDIYIKPMGVKLPETWPELAKVFIDMYCDKRPMYEVIEELCSAKYEIGESLREFYKRLARLQSLVIETIHARYGGDGTLEGRIATINDLTLHRFVYHSHPGMSRVLKYNTHDTISHAYSAGVRIEEESPEIYDMCFTTNHETDDCFQKCKTAENKDPKPCAASPASSDKRPMYQVIEELSSAKYENGESLQEFCKRLTGLQALVIETVCARTQNSTLHGRIAMINDLALHRFVYHSHPGISRILKCNTYDNISHAYSASVHIEEELAKKDQKSCAKSSDSTYS